MAFLLVDTAALRLYLRRPAIVLAATAWTSLAIPVLAGASFLALGLEDRSPDLFLALVLQAIVSPLMAAPAFAALMGLDATLVLCTMVASTALLPVTAPVFAHAFIGPALTLSPSALGLKLLALLAGSALVGFIGRGVAGPAAIERHRDAINGLNILVLFVFVAAVMESVAARFLATPTITIGLVALAFVAFFAVLGVTTLLFAFAGGERAHARVHGRATQRGADARGDRGSLARPHVAVLRLLLLPMYLSPLLLQPLARRLIARAEEGGSP